MKKKIKLELVFALTLSATLALLAVYADRSRLSETRIPRFSSASGLPAISDVSAQQVIWENIRGELRKGEFESTVQGVRNLASDYGGRVPELHMGFENEVWSGTLTCTMPTDNVTSFTFDVRGLINEHGKVTHISIDVKEVQISQDQTEETPSSEVSIYLYEREEGTSPLFDQLGSIVPLLTTSLVWIAEGLIVGVPLCFIALGVVMLVDRAIIPVWKKEVRSKSLAKGRTETVSS